MSTRPLFVLGLQRSGTTWLANQLAAHPDIVAVQSEDHFGIHESIYFSHFARAFDDLSDEASFDRFREAFASSDYYLLSGVDRSWIEDQRGKDHAQIFRGLMERVAERAGGAAYWLEKSPDHTLLAEELAASFPDARFVCIRRDVFGHLRSRLWAAGEPPPYPRRLARLFSLAGASSLANRSLGRFLNRCSRATGTTYEAMRANLAGELERVCDFLDLDFDPATVAVHYAANTSFPDAAARRSALSPLDRAAIGLFSALWRLAPLGVLRALVERRRRATGVRWPDWTWRRRDRAAQGADGA